MNTSNIKNKEKIQLARLQKMQLTTLQKILDQLSEEMIEVEPIKSIPLDIKLKVHNWKAIHDFERKEYLLKDLVLLYKDNRFYFLYDNPETLTYDDIYYNSNRLIKLLDININKLRKVLNDIIEKYNKKIDKTKNTSKKIEKLSDQV